MVEINIIKENALTLVEVNEELKKILKRDKELSFRANKTKEYLESFVKRNVKDVEQLKKKIVALDIPRLKDKHIAKIIDIMPKDIDSLKSLFSGEPITLKEEDLKKILNAVNE